MLSNTKKLKAGLAASTAVAALAMIIPAGASAGCGGGGITPAEIDICTPTPKARLLTNGMLVPPKGAPARVKAVIAAANRIRNKPYIYGGGHAKWADRGYDHGLDQLRPRLRRNRRLSLGHLRRHRRNGPALAR